MDPRQHLVGELHRRVDEPRAPELGEVLRPGQRPRDAADVAAQQAPLLRADVVLRDDVADPQPSAGDEHPHRLGKHGLVPGMLQAVLRALTAGAQD